MVTFESPLELYLHLYGWKQYNNFWSILAYTGILYLPLAWLLVENVLRSTKQAETAADAAVMSRRPLLIEMGMALVVIALAVTPFSTIQADALRYINPCIAQQQGSLGATGTTYDTAFDLAQDEIKIPLWWELVLAVSYGLNRAAIAGLGCTEDITLVRQSVQETKINDPLLAQELGDFREQCFHRARSEFAHQLKAPLARSQWAQVKAAQGWKDADLEWEGSRVYLEWAQFSAGSGTANAPIYRLLHAQYPVLGFAFDPNRETDQNYEQQIIDAQVAAGQPFVVDLTTGIPYCNEWWLGTTADNGLSTRLLTSYQESWLEWAQNSLTTKSKQEIEDDFLKSLIKTETSIPFDGNALGSDYVSGFSASFASDTGQAFLDIFTEFGVALENLSTSPMLNAIKAALPIIKALLLMAVVMFIPIILVAAAYRLEVLFLITIGLVAINFLSVIWGVAWALENTLVNALWPDQVDFVTQLKFTAAELTDRNWTLKLQMLRFLLPFLYLFLPVVFFAVMGWAGFAGFAALTTVMAAVTNPTQKAGRTGADTLKSKGSLE